MGLAQVDPGEQAIPLYPLVGRAQSKNCDVELEQLLRLRGRETGGRCKEIGARF